MKGLHRGPENLIDIMRTQAAIANLPQIGITENICFPAFQLNIAAAVDKRPESHRLLVPMKLHI